MTKNELKYEMAKKVFNNVSHYQSDLVIDYNILDNCDLTNEVFALRWFLRECGTHIMVIRSNMTEADKAMLDTYSSDADSEYLILKGFEMDEPYFDLIPLKG